MKLEDIANGRMAWASLSMRPLPAKLSYRIMKYARKVESEAKRLELHRVKLVRQHAGVGEKEDATLEKGSPEMQAFVADWTELLDGEADLPPCSSFTLQEVFDALKEDISPDVLGGLDPFFPEDDAEVHALKAVK